MDIINDKSTGHESDECEESSNESMEDAELIKEPEIQKKKKKRGIVYISTIPKFMTVAILREHLGRYSSIGRVYLQAAETKGNCTDATFGKCPFLTIHSISQKTKRSEKFDDISPKDGWSLRANVQRNR